jgi:pyridoxine 5-phosphate synthase
VPELAQLIRGEFPGCEFNIEGNPDARFVELVEMVKPDQATLVPDDIRQATSDHGWDIAAHATFLRDIVARLQRSGIRVSLFIDAEAQLPPLAAEVGADRVEIYTGPYGGTFDAAAKQGELDKVVATGNAAKAAGLGLNAGHDLTRDNLPALVAALPHLAEVSIGHAIIADALAFGIGETVRLFRAACGNPVTSV